MYITYPLTDLGPSFFAKPIVDYIFSGLKSVSAHVNDIPDPTTQDRIWKVCTLHIIVLHVLPLASAYVCFIKEIRDRYLHTACA